MEMSLDDFCYYMFVMEQTYFPQIQFIEEQFCYGYHDRDDEFDFYNNSLPV